MKQGSTQEVRQGLQYLIEFGAGSGSIDLAIDKFDQWVNPRARYVGATIFNKAEEAVGSAG